jgi:hypothetical protein
LTRRKKSKGYENFCKNEHVSENAAGNAKLCEKVIYGENEIQEAKEKKLNELSGQF